MAASLSLFYEYSSIDREDTIMLGLLTGRLLAPGDLVLLTGDLGAGKTTFTKGIASGLGLDPHEISSPSFAIVHEYPLLSCKGKFIHADLYRLDNDSDIHETGIDELVSSENIVVVEWGNVLYDECLNMLDIHIMYNENETETARRFLFHGTACWHKRLQSIFEEQ